MSVKYTILVICPTATNGSSTGFAPSHVSVTNVLISSHRVAFFDGANFIDFTFGFFRAGAYITTMDIARAMTPPSLDGMDRRIA
jgi:hypothetical protein